MLQQLAGPGRAWSWRWPALSSLGRSSVSSGVEGGTGAQDRPGLWERSWKRRGHGRGAVLPPRRHGQSACPGPICSPLPSFWSALRGSPSSGSSLFLTERQLMVLMTLLGGRPSGTSSPFLPLPALSLSVCLSISLGLGTLPSEAMQVHSGAEGWASNSLQAETGCQERRWCICARGADGPGDGLTQGPRVWKCLQGLL